MTHQRCQSAIAWVMSIAISNTYRYFVTSALVCLSCSGNTDSEGSANNNEGEPGENDITLGSTGTGGTRSTPSDGPYELPDNFVRADLGKAGEHSPLHVPVSIFPEKDDTY